MKKIWYIAAGLLVIFLFAAGCGQNSDQANNTSRETTTGLPEEDDTETAAVYESTTAEEAADDTEAEEDLADQASVVAIDVADYGTIKVQLDRDQAPITVDNFLKLVDRGFYDGLTFHRIMDGFMIQGGDPTGTGTGGSEETIKGEFSSNGVDNKISHVRGTISMARSQDNDSASSQFFIVQSDSTFLDGQYAGFGTVTEGMDVVDKICEDAEPTDNNGTIPAEKQPVITSIKVVKDN